MNCKTIFIVFLYILYRNNSFQSQALSYRFTMPVHQPEGAIKRISENPVCPLEYIQQGDHKEVCLQP